MVRTMLAHAPSSKVLLLHPDLAAIVAPGRVSGDVVEHCGRAITLQITNLVAPEQAFALKEAMSDDEIATLVGHLKRVKATRR